MILPYPDICLHFEEDDEDLWEVLKEINPEDRSTYIKNALRHTLLAKSAPEQDLNPKQIDLATSKEMSGIKEQTGVNEQFSLGDLSLDDLFTPGSSELNVSNVFSGSSKIPGFIQNSELSQETLKSPLEHLLFDVIGAEDDEEVLAILNSQETPKEGSESLKPLESPEPQKEIHDSDEHSKDTFNNQLEASLYPGLNHLLKEVIGEETDADIINLIFRRQKEEPSS